MSFIRLLPWVVMMVMSCRPFEACAQWTDMTAEYLLEATTQASWLGCGMSLVDFNLDGLDDLTFADSDGSVVAYAQLPDGGFDLVHTIPGTDQAQGVAWFDADGDEDLDLMLTRRFSRMELYMRSGETLIEEGQDRGLPINSDWEGRGISIADYDLDGDLDVYVCLYHDGSGSTAENRLFKNDGFGFFEDVTAIAGVGNGVKHSFQAIWFDYDHDGDEDLWVVNDRDIYPNALYQNMGDGSFVDIGLDLGVAQSIFGMTATVGDFDNDGFMELFCTNIEDEPNLLLDWNGGAYSDESSQMGVDGMRYSWGACFVDADGDMWGDLMVATYRFPNTSPYDNYYYHNALPEAGFEDLTEAEWPNEQTQLYCVGVCDINQDLAPDVIGFGNMPFVQILRNTTADDLLPPNRIAVHLCGTATNRWAIGAEVEVHAGGVVQEQFVSAGSDFMTQQTSTRYFGLADATKVDSLVVRWRGGGREVWYNLAPNADYSFIEGSTTAQILIEGTACVSDLAVATAPFDAPVVRWNGIEVSSPSIELFESGTYVVECEWMGGLFTWTDSIQWEYAEPHGFAVDWAEPLCHGEEGVLGWVADEGLSVEFEGESWAPFETNILSQAGAVAFVTVSPETGCSESHSFVLDQPTPLSVVLDYSAALCHGDAPGVWVQGYGGTPSYEVNWGGIDSNNLPEGQVDFSLSDANGCVLDSLITVVIPAPLIVEVDVVQEDAGNDASLTLNISGGTLPYSVLWNDGTEGDTVLIGLAQGVYSWVVEDANGCLYLGIQDIVNLDVLSESDAASSWSLNLTDSGWRIVGAPLAGDFLEVFSLTGKRAWHSRLVSGSPVEFDSSSFPSHGVIRIVGVDGVLRFCSAY